MSRWTAKLIYKSNERFFIGSGTISALQRNLLYVAATFLYGDIDVRQNRPIGTSTMLRTVVSEARNVKFAACAHYNVSRALPPIDSKGPARTPLKKRKLPTFFERSYLGAKSKKGTRNKHRSSRFCTPHTFVTWIACALATRLRLRHVICVAAQRRRNIFR